jgi:hypothetical protein
MATCVSFVQLVLFVTSIDLTQSRTIDVVDNIRRVKCMALPSRPLMRVLPRANRVPLERYFIRTSTKVGRTSVRQILESFANHHTSRAPKMSGHLRNRRRRRLPQDLWFWPRPARSDASRADRSSMTASAVRRVCPRAGASRRGRLVVERGVARRRCKSRWGSCRRGWRGRRVAGC